MCNQKPSKFRPLHPCLPYALFSSKITQVLAYRHQHSWCHSLSCHISRAVTLHATVCCLRDLDPRRVSIEIPPSSFSRARERACASAALQVTHHFLSHLMHKLWFLLLLHTIFFSLHPHFIHNLFTAEMCHNVVNDAGNRGRHCVLCT